MSPVDRTHHDDFAKLALDLSPAGMLVVDARGVIVVVNREIERLFGWSRDELVAQTIEILVPERFRARHPGHRTVFSGDPQSRPMGAGRELRGLRRDGTEFPLEIGLNPVNTEYGLFVFASVVDISARCLLEENLRRSQKLEAIGILAGGIAHDFNNILLGIVGHTELALRDAGLSSQHREDLERVLRASERGRQLVQRILAFSRKIDVVRVPLRLERSVNEALELLRASLPSTVEIRTKLDPDTPTVLSDETQVHQILMNLATNSAHAMPRGGTLEVRLEPFDPSPEFVQAHPGMEPIRHARLTLSDTGAGMMPDVLDHALEPFFTTKPPGKGTGLGLSVIHGIVWSQGGVMEIASAPDRGTTVSIYLPADTGTVSAKPECAGDVLMPRRLRVLFVEDEHDLAQMQRRQLEYLGFDVTVHTSSVAALEDFRSRTDAFELMITDDTMPRMTGSALAREILGLRPDLPVLMVSGGEGGQPEAMQRIGIRKVLRKPHTVAQLDQAIREVMGRVGED